VVVSIGALPSPRHQSQDRSVSHVVGLRNLDQRTAAERTFAVATAMGIPTAGKYVSQSDASVPCFIGGRRDSDLRDLRDLGRPRQIWTDLEYLERQTQRHHAAG
jgi:hypothetical protein